MAEPVTHPLLRPGALQYREYQAALALEAAEDSSLVVLPTGLGKTPVLLYLVLSKYSEGKTLVLAPTRPLVEQHDRFFRAMMAVPEEEIGFVHGLVPDRIGVYDRAKVVVSTPQTAQRDLESGLLDPHVLALVCYDEAHRAVGAASYVKVADFLRRAGARPLSVGLTATPGTNAATIETVCNNLGLTQVLSRTAESPDVAPYVQETTDEVIEVDLEPSMVEALKLLSRIAEPIYERANEAGRPAFFRDRLGPGTARKRILTLMGAVSASLKDRKPVETTASATNRSAAFGLVRDLAALAKLRHAIELAETQGSFALQDYLSSLESDKTKAAGVIRASAGYKALRRSLTADGFHDGTAEESPPPKFVKIREMIEAQLQSDPDSKVIVFATYRAAVELLYDYLSRGSDKIRATRFTGQATGRMGRGMSQKDQREAMKRFGEGEFNVLISTSVGEEGIDVKGADMVIMHEPPNSTLRNTQRKGRTARFRAGRVVTLATKASADTTYLQANRMGEKSMRAALRKGLPPAKQATLWEVI